MTNIRILDTGGIRGIQPVYKTKGSACADILLPEDIVIKAGEHKYIETRIALDIEDGWKFVIHARSSTIKKGLIVPIGIIDSDYHGELHISAYNYTDNDIALRRGDSIAQIEKQPVWTIHCFTKLDVTRISGLGSTDPEELVNSNIETYNNVLQECLMSKCSPNASDIGYELIGKRIEFDAKHGLTNTRYVAHELQWYLSEDLSIKGHAGIENNKTWQKCANYDGYVNSNYGFLVFNKGNYSQFDKCLGHLKEDLYTKRAVAIYNRPSIHDQWRDNVHAKHDMICTMYTQFIYRDNELNMIVNMRSNDAWFGLRNDFEWQRYVLCHMAELLNVKVGKIIWFAGSLHIYNWALPMVNDYLKEHDDEVTRL